VANKQFLCSDAQWKEIPRIALPLDGVFKKKSNTHKQWQATKFRDIKHAVDATEPDRLKVKDIYDRLKATAKSIGQAERFETRK
jgi:hypothetical protein